MSFVEKISVLVTTKVDSGLRGFRTSIAEADGLVNKFKAGWKNASAQISANAGMLATTAGAALVAFGVKALAAFQNSAKAAIDMSKATGLSIEQASRWIAVGDDFGVTADQLTASMGRLGKNMDAKVMAEYGIATRDASGQAREANDIFLDVMEVLNNTAPAERARVGQELLGKGFANIAPLIGKTREEYEAMLSTVEDGQVITDKEAKKSEKMRLAQDKLNDAIGEFTLATGEAATGLAPLVERIAQLVTYANELGLIETLIPPTDTAGAEERIGSVGDAVRDMARAALASGDAVAYLMDHGFSERGAVKLLQDFRTEMANSVEATQEMSPSAYDASRMLDKEADSVEDVTDALTELDEILSGLDQEEAALNLADQFAETKRASEEAFYATVSGAEDAEEELGNAQQSVIDLKREVIDYATKVANLPEEQITQIVALIDQGKLAEADALLKKLTALRMAYIVPVVGSSGGGGSSGPPSGGSGGKGNGGSLKDTDSFGGDRSQPIVVQFVVNDRVVQEFTAIQEQQKRGSR